MADFSAGPQMKVDRTLCADKTPGPKSVEYISSMFSAECKMPVGVTFTTLLSSTCSLKALRRHFWVSTLQTLSFHTPKSSFVRCPGLRPHLHLTIFPLRKHTRSHLSPGHLFPTPTSCISLMFTGLSEHVQLCQCGWRTDLYSRFSSYSIVCCVVYGVIMNIRTGQISRCVFLRISWIHYGQAVGCRDKNDDITLVIMYYAKKALMGWHVGCVCVTVRVTNSTSVHLILNTLLFHICFALQDDVPLPHIQLWGNTIR